MKVLAVFRYGFFFHKIVILFHASSIRVSIWIFLHEIVMHYSLCYTDCYFDLYYAIGWGVSFL